MELLKRKSISFKKLLQLTYLDTSSIGKKVIDIPKVKKESLYLRVAEAPSGGTGAAAAPLFLFLI